MLAARLYITDQYTESGVFKSSPIQNPLAPLKDFFYFGILLVMRRKRVHTRFRAYRGVRFSF